MTDSRQYRISRGERVQVLGVLLTIIAAVVGPLL